MNYLATPLVTLAGTPDSPTNPHVYENNPLYTSQQLERVTVCEQNVAPSEALSKLTARLEQVSVGPHWDPREVKRERLSFRFSNFIDLPMKNAKPSVLSPKHPACKAPIFSKYWVEKYQFIVPAVTIGFFDCPAPGSPEEDDLVASLNGLVDELNQSGGTVLMAVICGNGDMDAALTMLKRETDLTQPSQVMALSANDKFADQIVFAAQKFADQFFRHKFEQLRRKREHVMPPLDLMVWDARYTLKLAFCAEFRGDVQGAMRLYESAYDSLTLLFEKRAVTKESEAYTNARDTLDLIALKMFHHSLPSKAAYRKLLAHTETVKQILQLNKVDLEAPDTLVWLGRMHAVFAQLCMSFKQLEEPTVAQGTQPAGIPTGLVWLDAATLFARAEKGDAKTAEFTPQMCFINAISDLAELRRAKAYALMQYGDYLGDDKGAAEAYKTARRLLAASVWPRSEQYLGEKLNDELALFALGESKTPPTTKPDLVTENDILLVATGNWQSRETYIGRETVAQVRLLPKVDITAEIEVEHSLGTQKFADVGLVAGQEKVLEVSVTPLEIGQLILKTVSLSRGEFSQQVPIKRGENLWVTGSTVKHLDLVVDPRAAEVTTRPAKLKFGDLTPAAVGIGEEFAFRFNITSLESEEVDADVSVALGEDKIYSEQLHLGAELVTIEGLLSAPKSVFSLHVRAQFNTTQDTLPVTFEFTKVVDVMRPFRVTFDVAPVFYEHPWPAVFAPVDLEPIPRRWRLTSTVCASFEPEQLVLHSTELEMSSSATEFDLLPENNNSGLDFEMPFNAVKRISHLFLATTKCRTVAQPQRNFEATANVRLKWSRKSTPNLVNTLLLPPVRLNLPTQEPRVLVVCDREPCDTNKTTQVTYHLENATAAVLNFSVAMSSSTFFAYEGPRVAHVKMLPYSTRKLTYELIPLGDGAVGNRRPLPDLRVYDVNFKHVLPILPGDELITFDQQTLFI